MCGRFTQTKSREDALEETGHIELPPLFHRRYNIAPTQQVGVIHQQSPDRAQEFIWGFKNLRFNTTVINARIETLSEKPMFKNLLTRNRCLIPADGFYEWKNKQPYYFQIPEKKLFAFAGLWNEGRCVILTRAADKNMQGIHDRMPLIIRQPDWSRWLKRFELPDAAPLIANPVSKNVNRITHDSSDCLNFAAVQTDLSLFPDEE